MQGYHEIGRATPGGGGNRGRASHPYHGDRGPTAHAAPTATCSAWPIAFFHGAHDHVILFCSGIIHPAMLSKKINARIR